MALLESERMSAKVAYNVYMYTEETERYAEAWVRRMEEKEASEGREARAGWREDQNGEWERLSAAYFGEGEWSGQELGLVDEALVKRQERQEWVCLGGQELTHRLMWRDPAEASPLPPTLWARNSDMFKVIPEGGQFPAQAGWVAVAGLPSAAVGWRVIPDAPALSTITSSSITITSSSITIPSTGTWTGPETALKYFSTDT